MLSCLKLPKLSKNNRTVFDVFAKIRNDNITSGFPSPPNSSKSEFN